MSSPSTVAGVFRDSRYSRKCLLTKPEKPVMRNLSISVVNELYAFPHKSGLTFYNLLFRNCKLVSFLYLMSFL